LGPVLERFFVCQGYTASIEQIISLLKRIMGEQWHGTEAAEERRLVLSLRARREPEMPEELLADAQRIWRENFDTAQRSSYPSLGVRARVLLRRRLQKPRAGAAGWLEERRLATAKAALEAPARSQRATAAEEESTATWVEKHEAEVQHQKRERQARDCAAVEEGTAPKSAAFGGRAPAAAAMRAFHLQETARARELVLNQRRQQATRAAPRPIAIHHGARVFVEAAAPQQLDRPPGNRSRLRRSLGLQEVTQRHMASIVVVPNPAEPGDRNVLVSAVLGQAL